MNCFGVQVSVTEKFPRKTWEKFAREIKFVYCRPTIETKHGYLSRVNSERARAPVIYGAFLVE